MKLDFSPRFVAALLLTGVIAGVVGILLTHLLHAVQQWTFLGTLNAEHISFRQLVQESEPLRRFWALLACGVVVGLAWTALHRYGAPLLEIKEVVRQPEKNMPVKTTIVHALLQILTVGMGSPLGREVAPREMSVALATPLSIRLNLSNEQKSVLLACASGAGLAAVYNVPLAATIFILETLLLSWTSSALFAALMCCCVAVLVVRLGLGDLVQYANIANLEAAEITYPMVVWSIAAGIFIAIGVNMFTWCNKKMPTFARHQWIMLPISVVAFGLIGLMAMKYPEILGNGKAANQVSFADLLTWQDAMGLLAAKWIAVLLATMAGAYGGRITPSMVFGGLIAFLVALLWNLWLPEISVGAAAFIGATVFLGLAQNMRITAIVFMLELSRLSTAYWLPVCLCMAVALGVQSLWAKQIEKSAIA